MHLIMDSLINKYLLTAFGAVMTWLFFYAFKHPDAYSKRSPILMLLTFTIASSAFCWFLSAMWHFKAIISLVPKDKTAEIQRLINISEINLGTTLIVFIIINGYIFLLSFIHDILGTKESKKE